MPVGGAPGFDEFGRGGLAQHFLDGGEEVTADDGVVLRTDPDRDVLPGDVLDGGEKRRGVLDVFGVGEHRGGQGLLLAAGALVALVEDLAELRIALQHAGVEVGRQGDAVFAEDGDRGLHEADLIRGQHGCGSLEKTMRFLDSIENIFNPS